ncbi:hypothetical protein L226DRAFT_295441 [Lentinus tigrinus ALCF2SS1-7]|uniref:uncharacterized protein n=1 Tax=Lentinus tigrinus ALCF2SS1-7 TaxID=1328758 RepID=UPI00116617A8|nr:hypothetical protein L226DRAFT_295441 [Lentinus tigrinus ALCF2SS1-7]
MTSSPQPLPSLPPSPSSEHAPVPLPAPKKNEEDIAQVWHEDEPTITDAHHLHPHARKKGGKGKERAGSESNEDDEEDSESAAAAGYPPTKEEEAESRRVAENLRRWEIAERQRRKIARESASAAPTSTTGGLGNAPSLLADLFRRDSRKVPLGGVGTHQQLSTTDKDTESVPLEELDTPSADRLSFSPSPGPPTPEPENPFETPNPSRTSLNVPAQSAVMTESDTVPEEVTGSGPSSAKAKNLDVQHPPTLQASSSLTPAPGASKGKGQGHGKKRRSQRPPPPPQPLDLPPPRDPPPRMDEPNATKPPEPVAPPSVESSRNASLEEEREAAAATESPKQVDLPPVRWWHEWLCGCGEGPDRGGDNQAGRTNPFE